MNVYTLAAEKQARLDLLMTNNLVREAEEIILANARLLTPPTHSHCRIIGGDGQCGVNHFLP